MYISKLTLANYRNFYRAKVVLDKGVNTIIGANGVGKTNLFRALRLILDQNMLTSAFRMDRDDFHRGLDDWRGHWIVISAEFKDLSSDEAVQALFTHGAGQVDSELVDTATCSLLYRPRKEIRARLAALEVGDVAGLARLREEITAEEYEVLFVGRGKADWTNPVVYKELVGDFEQVRFPALDDLEALGSMLPRQLSLGREVSFAYIPALRDVVGDFQANRLNPLRHLLTMKSGEVDASEFAAITDQVVALNTAIEDWPDVKKVSADIRSTIRNIVGDAYSPSSLSIKSNLPDNAQRLFQSLKLFVGEDGEGYEGGIDEMSLGGANLLYLTLKILEFKYRKERKAVANFLVIEEPEAHIHNHIQKTLFDRIAYDDAQVIYSTHSTQISEVSNVRRMNVLGRDGRRTEVYEPARGLDDAQVRKLQRYLDAVRTNLLFANSVILVEGDAEELLLPSLVKMQFGLSVDELGISIVNVRSTGFQNVASIFHDNRIRKKCAVLTDLDAPYVPTDPVPEGDAAFVEAALRSAKAGDERAESLRTTFANNGWVASFFADHTFEVDFIKSGNVEVLVKIVPDVWVSPTKRTEAIEDLRCGLIERSGRRALAMAEKVGKGWFAVSVADAIDHTVRLPSYVLDAIAFAAPLLSHENWIRIFLYRIKALGEGSASSPSARTELVDALKEYKKGGITLDAVSAKYETCFHDDSLNDVLGRYL
ncbi:AAA family ATPase [Microbacteriaceae bacterium VKM Ac-2854]|nr:AAA family ATPase [Microbacteriaceae bacterium VKM Ac-2854]